MHSSTDTEPFARRVQTLRDAWLERRQTQSFAGSHDFDSQYHLILTLHEWACDALEEIATIYGATVDIGLSPAPERGGAAPAFSLAVAGTYSVNFALQERGHPGSGHWTVAASVISNAPGGLVVPAGPERRNGQWTRGRLEELLLSVLGAYERARSDRDSQGASLRASAR
jgi:hypothetical protein